jgi:hypothetical protein
MYCMYVQSAPVLIFLRLYGVPSTSSGKKLFSRSAGFSVQTQYFFQQFCMPIYGAFADKALITLFSISWCSR